MGLSPVSMPNLLQTSLKYTLKLVFRVFSDINNSNYRGSERVIVV